MRLRTLFLLGMVVSFLFALGLLLGPAIILKFFGFTGTATEVLLAQVIGAGLVGVGILSWFAKDFAEPGAISATLISFFIAGAVAFIVSLLGMIAKVLKSGNAWVAVVLFLVFAGGFGYFQFFGPRE